MEVPGQSGGLCFVIFVLLFTFGSDDRRHTPPRSRRAVQGVSTAVRSAMHTLDTTAYFGFLVISHATYYYGI